MKLEEYIGKEVRIKKNSKHPHAGECGKVTEIREAQHVGKGLIVEGEHGENFFVFNINHLQILE